MPDPSPVRLADYARETAIGELQALIDEALASGVSEVTFDEIIAEARERRRDQGPQ